MNDFGVGRKPNFPTSGTDAGLPVGFLGVHKKSLVEAPHFLENRSTNEHTRADNPIDFTVAIVIPLAVIPDERIIRQRSRQSQILHPRPKRRGKAKAGSLERPVGVAQLWTDDPDI